jgi:tellurite resistance protein
MAYTDMQINVWLRGLLKVAWADGDFTAAERATIIDLNRSELSLQLDFDHFDPISTDELVASLGHSSQMAENFLRTAMMVALADGVYSPPEATLLHEFHRSLKIDTQVLVALESTMTSAASPELGVSKTPKIDVLAPVAEWLDGLEIHDPRLARFLCTVIPPPMPL